MPHVTTVATKATLNTKAKEVESKILFDFLSYHTHISDFAPASSKEFLNIQATIECGFTLKRVRDRIRTYSQMQRADKYSQYSSII